MPLGMKKKGEVEGLEILSIEIAAMIKFAKMNVAVVVVDCVFDQVCQLYVCCHVYSGLCGCSGLMFLIDIESQMRKYQRRGETVVTLFDQRVRQHPDRAAVIMIDDKTWTFRDLDTYSNRVANFFSEHVCCHAVSVSFSYVVVKCLFTLHTGVFESSYAFQVTVVVQSCC